MKNPFRVAPRCVQWAAVIMVAVPISSIVVALNVTSTERLLTFRWILLGGIALQFAYAVGLLFGMKLVRLLLAANLLYGAIAFSIFWFQQGFSSTNLVNDLTGLIAPCITLVLVFLPASNRYFSGKPKPEPAVEKIEKRAPWGFWPIARIVVLLLLLVVGIPLVRHYRPTFENATYMNKAQKVAYAQYQEDLQDLQIAENLRLLDQAQNQFFMEHPGMAAEYSDLVGPNHFVTQLTTSAAGEKYPDKYISGKEPVATLPDGRIVFFDRETFKAKRVLPR